MEKTEPTIADELAFLDGVFGHDDLMAASEPVEDDYERHMAEASPLVSSSLGGDGHESMDPRFEAHGERGGAKNAQDDVRVLRKPSRPPEMVVVREALDSGGNEGRRIRDQFGFLVGNPLRLVRCAAPEEVRGELRSEFPYATAVVDALVDEVARRARWGDGVVRLSDPILLVGPPGCGKSTLARRFMQAVGLPHVKVSAGGATDGHLLGVSRGWHSGMPSAMMSEIARHRVANPGIVVDEIDKVSPSRQNGNLWDSLLSVLEPSEAQTFRDPYLLTPCDVSAVVWVFTANELGAVPEAVRSRCRIVRVPPPRPQDVPALCRAMLQRIADDLRVHEAFIAPLDGEEAAALVEAFAAHRDLRVLRRQLERILDLRPMPRA